jgi:hypothetical protein
MEPEPAPNEIIEKEIKAIQKQARRLDPEDFMALGEELYKLEITIGKKLRIDKGTIRERINKES